jgi:nitroimidazol reductase NimA-like FMN-containing flavoprotein (pyridoxamine 5'-phosphate oxidase superfamily)
MARRLTTAEAHQLLAEETVAHLGCVANNEPYVVPINYVFEDDAIFSHSLPGLKIEALRIQPRLCLQVEQIKNNIKWRSAQVFGDFEEIDSPEERRYVLNKLSARFPLLTPVESVRDSNDKDCIVFRVVIDRISGITEEDFEEASYEIYRTEFVDWISGGIY